MIEPATQNPPENVKGDELAMDEKLLLTVAHFDLQLSRLQSFARKVVESSRPFSGAQSAVLISFVEELTAVAAEPAPKWDRESLRKLIRPQPTPSTREEGRT